PYVNIGQQDLTAHVDFTTLQRHGESLGLMTLGLTQQGLFLMALGLGDRLNALSQNPQDIMTIFQRRDALHQLINPMGLGGFYVLLQSKNLNAAQQETPLRGLAQP
ncbi:MAG: SAM-dependent methyltransferase, partial [Limnothrix sp.]